MPGNANHESLPPWGSAIAGAAGAVLANAIVYPLDIVKTKIQVQVKKPIVDEYSSANSGSDEIYYTSTLHALSNIFTDEGMSGLYSGMAGSLLGVASTNFAYFYWYSVVRSVYLSKTHQMKPPNTGVELLLGAAAGAIAQVFTIPVSVVTTRQQTQKKMEKHGFLDTAREVVDSEDGYSGLWRGLKASLVLVVNPAITYGAFQRLRENLFPMKTHLRPWELFVLGAMSKALATLATQPLIVAKVILQSRPPAVRQGKPFGSFVEVMSYLIQKEGPLALYKGIIPQIMKGILVQGLLMMAKDRVELLFILLYAYTRKLMANKLAKAASGAAKQAKDAFLANDTVGYVRQSVPALIK